MYTGVHLNEHRRNHGIECVEKLRFLVHFRPPDSGPLQSPKLVHGNLPDRFPDKIGLVIYRERVFKLQNHVLCFGIFCEMSGKFQYIV